MKNKTALITGITGQDGSYLTEFLLQKNYDVHGIVRRSSSTVRERLDNLNLSEDLQDTLKNNLHYGDLADFGSLLKIINQVQPDEIYNLAAQSHVRVSFDVPEYTSDITGIGTLRLLEAIRKSGINSKFYQASSSELFGKAKEIPQNELTPFYPCSPYAVAKAYSHYMTVNYRESYDIFASTGILFNHESPRRGENFVTRKISLGVASIYLGLSEKITLGNLGSKRDWGFAGDYVEAMWLIMQQNKADDFVISTGKTHSVRDFIEQAFNYLDIKIEWKGSGINEVAINSRTGKTIIDINPKFFRPTEVDYLLGDYSKAQNILGWTPKTDFKELVNMMVKSDLKLLDK